jgi:hypothetical protein
MKEPPKTSYSKNNNKKLAPMKAPPSSKMKNEVSCPATRASVVAVRQSTGVPKVNLE